MSGQGMCMRYKRELHTVCAICTRTRVIRIHIGTLLYKLLPTSLYMS